MFRILFALAEGEQIDTDAVHSAGFAGVEVAGAPALTRITGVAGCRISSVDDIRQSGDVPAYWVIPAAPVGTPGEILGHTLREKIVANEKIALNLASGGAFSTAAELWALLEAIRHPRIKVALDFGSPTTGVLRPAVVIPTLNHRIGCMRIRAWDSTALEAVRRLAGIGFEGYLIADPLQLHERLEAAIALKNQIESSISVKPAKKTTTPAR